MTELHLNETIYKAASSKYKYSNKTFKKRGQAAAHDKT